MNRKRRRQQQARGWKQQMWPWVQLFAALALIVILLRLEQRDRRFEVRGSVRVIDGDSLVVDGQEVRMKNIDAPEGRQMCRREKRDWACGEEAARQLKRLAGRGEVSCRGVEHDQHDRLLGLCAAGGVELNRAMVAEGWAVSFGGYRSEEDAAKKARRGIWASEFERPSDWRAAGNR